MPPSPGAHHLCPPAHRPPDLSISPQASRPPRLPSPSFLANMLLDLTPIPSVTTPLPFPTQGHQLPPSPLSPGSPEPRQTENERPGRGRGNWNVLLPHGRLLPDLRDGRQDPGQRPRAAGSSPRQAPRRGGEQIPDSLDSVLSHRFHSRLSRTLGIPKW